MATGITEEELYDELLSLELHFITGQQRCYNLRKRLGLDGSSPRKGGLSQEEKDNLVKGLTMSIARKHKKKTA